MPPRRRRATTSSAAAARTTTALTATKVNAAGRSDASDRNRAERLAGAVPGHVDDRLGLSLRRLRQGRVEQLVAGAEDGVARRGVEAAGQDTPPRAREREGEEGGAADHGRVARDRSPEPEPGQHGAPDRRLDDEREDGRTRVEEAEELDEHRTLVEVRHGLGLHRVVGEGADTRGEQDDEREVSQVRIAPDERERRLTVRRVLAALLRHGTPPDHHGANGGDARDRPESREKDPLRGQRADALGPEAAEEPSERRRRRDLRHERLGRVRVEPLVE